MNALVLQHVMKSYRDVQALNDLCLEVPSGSIFGLLGPNGAGKTTAIRVMLGLVRPDAGSISVLGAAPGPDSVALRRHIGFAPEEFALYPDMTGEEILAFNAALYGVAADSTASQLQKVFELPLKKRVGGYSKGMRKLLALYVALSTEPELLILDEPTEGLDPVARSRFLSVLAEKTADSGLTVFLSSHILSEVEKICDTVAFMKSGHALLQDEIASLKTDCQVYTIRSARDISDVELHDPAVHHVEKVGQDLWDIQIYAPEAAAVQLISGIGGTIVNVQRLSFESVFMRLMEEV